MHTSKDAFLASEEFCATKPHLLFKMKREACLHHCVWVDMERLKYI